MNLRKGIFKKAIAHTLLISLFCSILPTNAYATVTGENFGGGITGGTTGGSFSNNNIGYRISIVNESGQVVSRVIDLLFDAPANKGVNYIAAKNTKVQPYDPIAIQAGSLFSGVNIVYTNDMSVLGKHTTGITTAVAKSEYGGFSGEIPKPILPDGDGYKGNGRAFQEWFLGGKESFGSGEGGGSSNTKYEDGGVQQGNVSSSDSTDKLVNACSRLEQNMERYLNLLKKESGYSEASARTEIAGYGLSTAQKLASSGNYTQAEQQVLYATVASTLNKLFSSTETMHHQGITEQAIESLSGWFENGETFKVLDPFKLAHAADGEPVPNVNKLMNFKVAGGKSFLFDLDSSINLVVADDGNPSIIATCCAYNLKIIVEPILWFPPTKGTSATAFYKAGVWFYGTPTNYGQFVADVGFRDSSANDGGWYRQINNIAAAWSMWIQKDLIFTNGLTIESPIADDGTYPNTYNSVTNTRLADITQGIAMHYYYGNPESATPDIPTYDTTEADPNPEPHPAQDPDPNTGIINLMSGEPKVPGTPITPDTPPDGVEPGWLNTTRAVNIVKTYEIERLDGTTEHVVTKVQQNCPNKINVLHEPNYKVKEFFSSKDYYDYVSEDKLSESTTWDSIITTAIPTDKKSEGYNQEFTWEEIAAHHGDAENMGNGGVKAGENSYVELWTACKHFDPSQEKVKPIDLSRTDISHYGDNTLYVRLVKKEQIPQSHTYDYHNYDKQPNDSPDPTVDTEHPEYPENPVSKDNRFLNYNVVKVYEQEQADLTNEVVAVFTRREAPPIYDIEDEPFYRLIEWRVKDHTSNPLDSLDESSWDSIVKPGSHVDGGVSPTQVNMLDLDDMTNETNNRTLYVLLRAPSVDVWYDGDIIIQQSQISKTIHTNDPTINVAGGYWGNYKFTKQHP